MGARKCKNPSCDAEFEAPDGRYLYCGSACRAAYHSLSGVRRRRFAAVRPAAPPGGSGPDPDAKRPWTMVEALVFVSQLADLRRELTPPALFDLLTQEKLDRLRDAVRAAARGAEHEDGHPGRTPAEEALRDGAGDRAAGPRLGRVAEPCPGPCPVGVGDTQEQADG